jgi:ribosomal subunit interface protein
MEIKYKISDITDEADARAYVEKKLAMLEKFMEDPKNSHWNVRIAREESSSTAHVFTAEATLQAPSKNFGATGKADSLYAAIDQLKDDIKTKMIKHKGKRVSMLRKGGRLAKKMLQR